MDNTFKKKYQKIVKIYPLKAPKIKGFKGVPSKSFLRGNRGIQISHIFTPNLF